MIRLKDGKMKKEMGIFLSLGIILIGLGAAASYLFLFRHANPPLPKNAVKIGNALFNVELATSTLAQARGLSYRESLGADQGMLFIFSGPSTRHFWMKDMNFPIDIIWIGSRGDGTGGNNNSGKVLGFAENAVPQPGAALWSLTIYHSPDGTDKVLEVNAGIVAKYGIKVGDAVQIGI